MKKTLKVFVSAASRFAGSLWSSLAGPSRSACSGMRILNGLQSAGIHSDGACAGDPGVGSAALQIQGVPDALLAYIGRLIAGVSLLLARVRAGDGAG